METLKDEFLVAKALKYDIRKIHKRMKQNSSLLIHSSVARDDVETDENQK
jgi:hypothetical protein